jgi:benzodiazapine receptor
LLHAAATPCPVEFGPDFNGLGLRMKKWMGIAGWVLLPFAAAAMGVQPTAAEFYASLAKPAWAPPPGIFGPVWTLLYLLMGIAAAIVWSRYGFARARAALTLFLVQLVVNAIWSPVFFRLQRIELALAVILVLDLLVAATMVLFWRKDRRAAWLLAPYLAWIAFASALNFAIVRLN